MDIIVVCDAYFEMIGELIKEVDTFTSLLFQYFYHY